jgi:hypothetical protein
VADCRRAQPLHTNMCAPVCGAHCRRLLPPSCSKSIHSQRCCQVCPKRHCRGFADTLQLGGCEACMSQHRCVVLQLLWWM